MGNLFGKKEKEAADGVDADDVCYILGTQCMGAQYQFTGGDLLSEMAAGVKEMGGNHFKMRLTPKAPDKYGISVDPSVQTIAQLCQTEPFAGILGDPQFKWYHFWYDTYSSPKTMWTRDWTEETLAAEYAETKEWATFMLTTYNGTGKRFMAGNWEGDWQLLGASGLPHKKGADPSDEVIQRMVLAYGARQRAIEDARNETPHDNVGVFFYIEMNLGPQALNGVKGVTNNVLPAVNPDLVSYSSYSTTNSFRPSGCTSDEAVGDLEKRFYDVLDHVQSKLTEKDLGLGFQKRVCIGEYGIKNNGLKGKGGIEVCRVNHARRIQIAAIKWGCPFTLYWAFHGTHPTRNMWLVSPKGEKNLLYQFHQDYYAACKEFVASFCKDKGRSPTPSEFGDWAVEWISNNPEPLVCDADADVAQDTSGPEDD